ncbi:30S ribosomal protein S15 [Candidatus Dependentiae bacterium]
MLSREQKENVLSDWGLSGASVGSTEAQVCFLTARISQIAKHLKDNHKDHSSRLGLVKLVGRRRRLLAYLKRQDLERFNSAMKQIKA